MSKEEDIINAPWNMAQIYYIELAKLLRFKDASYLEGDINAYYKGLRQVYKRIYFKLNENERALMENKFYKALETLRQTSKEDVYNNGVLYDLSLDILESIDMAIVTYMDKYKMIFPDVEIKSLDSYEKKMGLI